MMLDFQRLSNGSLTALCSNSNPGMLLDFRRFRAASVATFADAQVDALRAGSTTANYP